LRGSQISFPPAPSLVPEPIRHKINRLRGTVEEYYGSEFQAIPIKRFISRALTYIQTYKHKSKVKTISTPMHYVLGVDNDFHTNGCVIGFRRPAAIISRPMSLPKQQYRSSFAYYETRSSADADKPARLHLEVGQGHIANMVYHSIC